MFDPSMLGMYGMGGSGSDDDMMTLKRNALAASLIQGMGPQQGKNSGPGQMGQGLISFMLMNPKLMKQLTEGMGNGLGNWFSGNNWNGTPGDANMQGLQQQAAGNLAGGGVLY